MFVLESLVFVLIGISLHAIVLRHMGTPWVAQDVFRPVAGIVAVVLVSRFVWMLMTDLQLPINFFFCNLIGESTCNDICQARHSSPDNSCSGRSIGSAIKVTTQSGDCPDVKIQVW
nr:hypothetical protein [Komagataeibacter europaeus]